MGLNLVYNRTFNDYSKALNIVRCVFEGQTLTEEEQEILNAGDFKGFYNISDLNRVETITNLIMFLLQETSTSSFENLDIKMNWELGTYQFINDLDRIKNNVLKVAEYSTIEHSINLYVEKNTVDIEVSNNIEKLLYNVLEYLITMLLTYSELPWLGEEPETPASELEVQNRTQLIGQGLYNAVKTYNENNSYGVDENARNTPEMTFSEKSSGDSLGAGDVHSTLENLETLRVYNFNSGGIGNLIKKTEDDYNKKINKKELKELDGLDTTTVSEKYCYLNEIQDKRDVFLSIDVRNSIYRVNINGTYKNLFNNANANINSGYIDVINQLCDKNNVTFCTLGYGDTGNSGYGLTGSTSHTYEENVLLYSSNSRQGAHIKTTKLSDPRIPYFSYSGTNKSMEASGALLNNKMVLATSKYDYGNYEVMCENSNEWLENQIKYFIINTKTNEIEKVGLIPDVFVSKSFVISKNWLEINNIYYKFFNYDTKESLENLKENIGCLIFDGNNVTFKKVQNIGISEYEDIAGSGNNNLEDIGCSAVYILGSLFLFKPVQKNSNKINYEIINLATMTSTLKGSLTLAKFNSQDQGPLTSRFDFNENNIYFHLEPLNQNYRVTLPKLIL